ncbi:AMP-dependent synthetase/ligase [Janibacter cremeus]|uniref:Acyl-CoA synthetase n=1 Tax=Janibacter cremeus TaxID=1285192 RepID=A0A852VRP8_9MICO|nr:long-chain fatty acid--CoA ligase [Janibacter cremeus]NYF98110.1 long-subunit acyl-CoA synthetase (AMP-forming) [Janibacter cremeus]
MADATTLCEAFQQTLTVDPSAVALRTAGGAVSVTWAEYGDHGRAVTAGLAALGYQRGDTLGIMLTNRPEFAWVDAGAMHLGMIPFSIYNTSSPEQVEYLFGNAGNRIVVTETALLPAILGSGVALDHIVVVDGTPEGATHGLADLESVGDPVFDFEAAWRAVQPDDVLTLIYTSGTTGPPKGVQLTHRNVFAVLHGAEGVVDVHFGDRITSFLPAAHIADRASAQYFNLAKGVQVTYIADPREIASALPDARPTVWFAVPRVWEKIKMGIEAKVATAESPVKQKLGAWALRMADKQGAALLAGEPLTGMDAAQLKLADRLVLSKIRVALGLDQLRWSWSGAAAIAPETLSFFMGLGVNVCELWGMSEVAGAGTINPPGKVKVGTVGPALPGFEMRIADDGEVLFRGDCVTPGYRGEPEKTAEAIDADGWLHTGDVGTIDADGYLTITDRKKELIISSSGKNMSPSTIENTLKVTTPLAATIAVVGERRPYNVALVTLDPDAAAVFAEKAGVAADPAVLAEHPALVAEIGKGIEAGNAKLSRVEQVKQFRVLPEYWAPGSDVLTPTLKLRRKPIDEHYAEEIEALYTR